MFISELFGGLIESKGIHKKVKIIRGPKDCVGKIGTVGEVRHGAFKGAPKTVTIDYARDDGSIASIQLSDKDVRLVKDTSVSEASTHQKEVARKRKEYEQKLDQKRSKEGETYHYGNAKVVKPPRD